MLCEEVEENGEKFEALSRGSQQHLFGEEEEVQRVEQKFQKVERGWHSVKEGMFNYNRLLFFHRKVVQTLHSSRPAVCFDMTRPAPNFRKARELV